tara:strand:+ start:346 stop:813 length:468 start_codon:yes stop_codon:yes gene_type:complete
MEKNKFISQKDLKVIKSLPKPIVLVPMSIDILHHGHIRILKKSIKLGTIVVGLMTDKGISSYKKKPILKYKFRKEVLDQIKLVTYIFPLRGLIYPEICEIINPDYFVHGTDWQSGVQKKIRNRLVKNKKKYQTKIIEYNYTKNITSTKLKKLLFN